jgi:hypothetical protein
MAKKDEYEVILLSGSVVKQDANGKYIYRKDNQINYFLHLLEL